MNGYQYMAIVFVTAGLIALALLIMFIVVCILIKLLLWIGGT